MLERFNGALCAALGDPEVQRKIAEISLEVVPTDSEQSALELQKSYRFWNSAGR